MTETRCPEQVRKDVISPVPSAFARAQLSLTWLSGPLNYNDLVSLPMPTAADYLNSLFGLEGRTAVVIGGNGVLGGAMVDALTTAGAYAYVVGRNEETAAQVVQRNPGRAEFVPADATSRADLEAIVARLREQKRSCDILINAAGVNSPTPFFEIDDEEWERIFNVNLRSVRISCQVFGKMMLDAGTQGAIINVASLSAITPLSRVFTYSASKAAVLNLTQNLAREWAASGIRVNALSPGFFPAEQNRKVLTADRKEKILNHTPAGRFGEPYELAGAVLLLASNVAGSFINGENIVVDGGFSSTTI